MTRIETTLPYGLPQNQHLLSGMPIYFVLGSSLTELSIELPTSSILAIYEHPKEGIYARH